MSLRNKLILSILLCISLLISTLQAKPVMADTDSLFPFVILSSYHETLDIGKEIRLLALTSNGKKPVWKSSDSRIASVNNYGVVTAKKYGYVVITAKITNAEASCYLSVNKTEVLLNRQSATLEHGESCILSAKTSNSSKVIWKSNKKSIATVNDNGTVTGQKPGEAVITATADGSVAACTVIVKSPSVKLDKTSLKLYRGESAKLTALVSSQISPSWKTNKKSVALVDNNGTVTAIKNGTAIIFATVDKVTAVCNITVQKPEINLSKDEITLKKGETARLSAKVSSGNTPIWSSSNTSLINVNSYGEIKAKQKGRAYIYAYEDGTKARCTVYVTD